MPVLRILVLALAFAQAAGVADLVEAACADDCQDQDCDDGACPPICPTCHCAPRSAIDVVTAALAPTPVRVATAAAFVHRDDAPISPEPGEILRVPIAA